MDAFNKILILIICISSTEISASVNNHYEDSLLMQHYYEAGLGLYSEGLYSQALDSFKYAFETGKKIYPENHFNLRNINNGLGIAYRNIGQYDKALEHFLLAEQSYRSDSVKNELAIARVYNNIGNVYYNKFNFGTALEYYQRAADIFLSREEVNYAGVSDIQYSMANIYYELRNNNKALEIIEEYSSLAYPESRLYFLSLKAAVFQVMNNYEEAYKSFTEAIEYAESLFSPEDLNVIFEYLNFATFLISNSNFEEALKVLDKIKIILKEKEIISGGTVALYHKTRGTYYDNLTVDTKNIDTFRKSKAINLRNAINSYEQGLKALHFKITVSASAEESSVSTVSLTQSLDLLKKIADTYLQLSELGERDDNEEYKKMISSALNHYNLTADLIQKARKEIYSESDKILLSELEEVSFYKIIKTAYIAHQLTGDLSLAELAFKNAERLKASSVFDKLTDQLAKDKGFIPDSLIELEITLNYNITSYNEKLYNLSESLPEDIQEKQKIDSLMFVLKKEREELNRYLEKNYKEYYNFKYSDSEINISDIQSKLDGDEVILEYVVNTNNRIPELYSFFLSSNQYKFEKLPAGTGFEKLVETVFRFLSDKNYLFTTNQQSKDYCAAAYNLYEILIKPFENEILNKKITVISDGLLSYIPFDALLYELPDTTENIQFNKLSYLILKNPVNYAYSSNLLFSDFSHNKINRRNRLLAFAPEYNSDTVRFQDENYILTALPGTGKEVELISKNINSKILTGSDASELNFRKFYRDYDILHLAMHAFINDSLPAFSCFAFTPADGYEQENDGWLNTADIYNLDLNARLSVLSACNTGAGKLKGGEGIMSLARGFFYAGCPSIIMTLWEAEDVAGTKIMNTFYKNLKKGKTKDEALRTAKIEFLENANPHMAHPHCWLGYVSIGNPSPLFRSYDFYFFLILFASLFGIIIDQLIKLNRKKQSKNLFHKDQ